MIFKQNGLKAFEKLCANFQFADILRHQPRLYIICEKCKTHYVNGAHEIMFSVLNVDVGEN